MNIEKYSKLHNEIMKKLENGEITVENAKEINDLAFNKYITEGKFSDAFNKVKKSVSSTVGKVKQSMSKGLSAADKQKLQELMQAESRLRIQKSKLRAELTSAEAAENGSLIKKVKDEMKKVEAQLSRATTELKNFENAHNIMRA